MNRIKVKPPKTGEDYLWLWKMVDAAVMDALKTHPEYVREELIPYARLSINKRVVGRVIGELRCNAERESLGQLTKMPGLATSEYPR